MYTKKEILEKIENGDTEEANDILLDFVEKLLIACEGEFYELKDEWNCNHEQAQDEIIDLTDLNWNFFEEQSIDFVVEDDY